MTDSSSYNPRQVGSFVLTDLPAVKRPLQPSKNGIEVLTPKEQSLVLYLALHEIPSELIAAALARCRIESTNIKALSGLVESCVASFLASRRVEKVERFVSRLLWESKQYGWSGYLKTARAKLGREEREDPRRDARERGALQKYRQLHNGENPGPPPADHPRDGHHLARRGLQLEEEQLEEMAAEPVKLLNFLRAKWNITNHIG